MADANDLRQKAEAWAKQCERYDEPVQAAVIVNRYSDDPDDEISLGAILAALRVIEAADEMREAFRECEQATSIDDKLGTWSRLIDAAALYDAALSDFREAT